MNPTDGFAPFKQIPISLLPRYVFRLKDDYEKGNYDPTKKTSIENRLKLWGMLPQVGRKRWNSKEERLAFYREKRLREYHENKCPFKIKSK